MKKFLAYLKNNNFTATLEGIILCSIIYCIRENFELKTQTITFINLIMLCILGVLCFNSVRKHYVKWNYLIYNLSLIFVFNRFYDETIFFEAFHFKLLYFLIALGVLVLIVIFYPVLKKTVITLGTFISGMLENWTGNRDIKNVEYMKMEEERQQKRREKYLAKQERKNSVKWEATEKISEEHETAESKVAQKRKYNLQNVLYVSIFICLLVITAGLLAAVTAQDSTFIKKITAENLLTVIMSVVVILLLLVFIAGMIVAIFIKWIQIIVDMLRKKHKGEWYFICACCLFLVSQYFFKNYSYTTDDVVDLILGGKLFTFPLILSILLPVFLIFTESIVEFAQHNSSVKKELKKFIQPIMKIAGGIVTSLFTFIAFVTSDFLTTIIDLIREDDSQEKESLEKTDTSTPDGGDKNFG